MANVASIKKALVAIRKGLGESFLQSSDAQALGRLVQAPQGMSDVDAQLVTAFLQGKEQGSGEIVGILDQMGENMAQELKEAEESEASAVADFDGLVSAKKKE